MTNKRIYIQPVSMIGKEITCAETGKVFIGASDGFTVNYATSQAKMPAAPDAREYLSDEGVDIRERRELLDRSKPFYAYVASNGEKITGWKGNVLGTITAKTTYRLTRMSYTHGKTINFYRVTDVHGGLWTGRGNPGIGIKLQPVKSSYKVHIGYTSKGNDKWRKFGTMEAASSFCNEVFSRTKVVLSIVAA